MHAMTAFAATLLATVLSTSAIALADGAASVSVPADKIQFGPTGVKTEIGELMAGPAYGDLTKGPHGTFVKMPAGFVSPLHTHTDDYIGVVISGVGENALPGGEEIRLPAGSYWFQRGKEAHITKCVSQTDCLFFIYQTGKFDYVPAN